MENTPIPVKPRQSENSVAWEKNAAEVLVEDAGVPKIDLVAEKRLIRKQDLIMMPLLWTMFYVAYLDRSAIGNARLMGLQKDLSLSNIQYLQCLMIFFVGNAIVEFPFALMIRYWPSRFVFGPTVILYGLAATLMAVSGGYGGVMTLRFFLGVGEGILTMAFIYLGQWYKADELAVRYCIMYWASPVASFSAGLIAYGVQKHMVFVDGLQSWKWLFIVEGIPSIALGIIITLMLPSLPDRVAKTGHFLFRSQSEKELMVQRSIADQNVPEAKFRPHQIWVTFKDPKTYFMALIHAAATIGVSAFAVLLPTFIKAFGFDPLTANLYSIIPYAFAMVTMPLGSWISDKYRSRAIPYAIFNIISIIGFVMLLATGDKVVGVAACCFVAAGCFPNICIAVAWVNATHGGWTKRCTAFAFNLVLVQGYGIMATQVYRTPPRFFLGHGVLLGTYTLSMISCAVMYFWQRNENRRRDADAEKRRTGESPPLGDIGTFEDLCDFHPDYRYVY